MGGTPFGWSGPGTRRILLSFRRARTVLGLCAVFWLWLLAGGPGWLPGVYESLMPTLMALYAVSVLFPVSMFAGVVAGALIRRFIVLQGSSAAKESTSGAGPASMPGRPILTVIQGWQAPVNRLAQSRWAKARLEQARALQNKWIQPWTGPRNEGEKGEQQRAG
jgi:hypothetical protein